MIRAILFDKDGTLTDFRATWEAWMPETIYALARASGADPAEIAESYGYDLQGGRIAADGLFVTATGDTVARAVGKRIGWPADRLAAWLAPRQAAVEQVAVPGLADLLGRLKRAGLALGVLTNADAAEAQAQLSRLQLAPHLDRIIGCDSGYGAKPDPAGAAAFADELGLKRETVVLVGDGLTDMAAARGAGLRAVAVLTGTLDRTRLAEHAEAVLPDVTHLPQWLATQGVPIPET
ncbi:HAD family hydrolase [uncultured Jannaschia sp.]|uniref:HAD family hydrolase n=1 Tax=uncultured Jannaschia sp. TaxID=293347 RepID=UPI002630F848|nr:HAD family hydrolase [uncultured Jannaschia sp.]